MEEPRKPAQDVQNDTQKQPSDIPAHDTLFIGAARGNKPEQISFEDILANQFAEAQNGGKITPEMVDAIGTGLLTEEQETWLENAYTEARAEMDADTQFLQGVQVTTGKNAMDVINETFSRGMSSFVPYLTTAQEVLNSAELSTSGAISGELHVTPENMAEFARTLREDYELMSAWESIGKTLSATHVKLSEKHTFHFALTDAVRDLAASMTETLQAVRKADGYEDAVAISKWLYENGYEDKEPADSLDIIFGVVKQAKRDGMQPLDMMPVFVEKLAAITDAADKEKTTIYDFMRGYAAHARQDQQETALTTGADVPNLQGLVPTFHTIINTALANALTQKPAINAGAFDLTVANKTAKRKELTAYTMISYESDDSGLEFLNNKMTEYERQVSDAVNSLWMEAKRNGQPPVFSTDMIYRAMPGGGDHANPATKGAITRTVEKLRRLWIHQDVSEEWRARGIIGKDETMVFDEPFFQMKAGTKTSKHGGQTVKVYYLTSEPVILSQALKTKQLFTLKASVKEIREVNKDGTPGQLMKMSQDRQALTGYMMRRIEIMKGDEKRAQDDYRNYLKRAEKAKKDGTPIEARTLASYRTQRHTIAFSTMFEETGTATTDRTLTKRSRDFCYSVLDYWKAIGHIAGYTEQKKGKTITGINIMLDKAPTE